MLGTAATVNKVKFHCKSISYVRYTKIVRIVSAITALARDSGVIKSRDNGRILRGLGKYNLSRMRWVQWVRSGFNWYRECPT